MFGLIVLVWPRFILFALTMIFMAIALNRGKNILDPKDKGWKDTIYKTGGRIILFALGGIIPTEIKIPNIEDIYKKYLGPDYQISYDEKFASIICNHVSWTETYFTMWKYATGYVGKLSASKVPTIREVGWYNQTIYCDRNNPDDRKITAEKIEKRQKGLMDGTILTNLSIYPEGTMTNGTHLIKFKRGAFMTCLPLKPHIQLIDQTEECTLAVAALPMHWHIVYSCCYFWHNVTFIDMPIIKPTQYMYDNYKKEQEENWMTFMNVTRNIMAEVGKFKTCEATFKPEKLDYLSAIKGIKIKNT